jgi:hypothetical protein
MSGSPQDVRPEASIEVPPEIYLRPAWRSQWKILLVLGVLVYTFMVIYGYGNPTHQEILFNALRTGDADLRKVLVAFPKLYAWIYHNYHYLSYLIPGLSVMLLLTALYRRYYKHYLIGPFGVEVYIGIIQRNVTRLEYTHTRGVTLHQSIFERILGYGDIQVSTSGVETELLIDDVKNPQRFSEEIKQRMMKMNRS